MSGNPSLFSCLYSILSKDDAVSRGDNVGDIVLRSLGIDQSLLVPQLVDSLLVAEYNHIKWSKFQRKYPSILKTPLFEPKMLLLA